MTQVVVLNADYTFLNTVHWKRALALVATGKVEVLEYTKRVIHCASGECMKIPAIMKLIKFIRTVYRTRVPFSKKNVMVRDGFRCAYCGTDDKGIRFTIDHVVPKSKGGKSTFENCVTSCKPCNNAKGDKSCEEARMYPKANRTAPTISEYLRMRVKALGVQDVIDDLFKNMK